MGWDAGFAQLFKDRDNKPSIGNVIGKVVSEKPLMINILDGEATLNEEQLYITHGAIEKEYKLNLETEHDIGQIAITSSQTSRLITLDIIEKDKTKLTLHFELRIGDEVLLIPSEGDRVFFIIDKIKKVGE